MAGASLTNRGVRCKGEMGLGGENGVWMGEMTGRDLQKTPTPALPRRAGGGSEEKNEEPHLVTADSEQHRACGV